MKKDYSGKGASYILYAVQGPSNIIGVLFFPHLNVGCSQVFKCLNVRILVFSYNKNSMFCNFSRTRVRMFGGPGSGRDGWPVVTDHPYSKFFLVPVWGFRTLSCPSSKSCFQSHVKSDVLRARVRNLKFLSLRPRPSVPGSWSYSMDHRELTPKDWKYR